MNKIKIIEAGNELSLGGTEYVIQLYSKYLNKDQFDVTVLGIRSGGERVEIIRQLGVRVVILNGNLLELAKLLKEADVFHWHGDGTIDPELFNVIKTHKPKLVIQTNIFGLYNKSPLYEIIDYDLYVSKMILIRRMYLDRELKDNFALKRKTLHNPVDDNHINSMLPSDEEAKTFRLENNLQDYFIVGRIGRASDYKFDLITLDGFAKFAEKISNARFLLVGTTPGILAYAKTLNIIDKLIIFENTVVFEKLLMYYKAIDIFLAASHIGESFGMVIAEAMTIGIPVVTISTEDRDNAQIELVDNNQTGLVVERAPDKIANALLFLYQNKKTRKRLSAAAKTKVTREYRADKIVKSLENLIYTHFNIPIHNPEGTLVVDFSMGIVEDYIFRCSNLWRADSAGLSNS